MKKLSILLITLFLFINFDIMPNNLIANTNKKDDSSNNEFHTNSSWKGSYVNWGSKTIIFDNHTHNYKIIGYLKRGDEVTSFGKTTQQNYRINIDNIFHNWTQLLKIRTKDNIDGWVFRSALEKIQFISGYKIFFIIDNLKIIDMKDNSVIIDERIPLPKNEKMISMINCTDIGDYIIIEPRPSGYGTIFTGIFDKNNKKWLNKIYGFPTFLGISKSRNYLAFSNGRDLVENFMIYSLKKNMIVYENKDLHNVEPLYWNNNNLMILWFYSDKEIPKNKNPKYFKILQKAIWSEGNLKMYDSYKLEDIRTSNYH